MAVTASGPDPLDTNVDERTPLNSSAQHATPSANTPDYSSITKGLTSDVHSSHGSDEERPLISPPELPGNDVKALTSISTVIGVLLLGMSRLLSYCPRFSARLTIFKASSSPTQTQH